MKATIMHSSVRLKNRYPVRRWSYIETEYTLGHSIFETSEARFGETSMALMSDTKPFIIVESIDRVTGY